MLAVFVLCSELTIMHALVLNFIDCTGSVLQVMMLIIWTLNNDCISFVL